jgi:competence ComEA-like helix-hairpin-helix protein
MRGQHVGKLPLPLIFIAVLVATAITAVSDYMQKKIDLNHASIEELQTIPGIGPAYAARIVHERERRQGFRSVTDLLKIRGIGRTQMVRIKKYVTVKPYKKIQHYRPVEQ